MDAPTATIWDEGALDEKHAAEFLSVSDRTFRTLRKRLKWPRKRIEGTTKIVYPLALLRAFLASCEDA